MSGGIGLSAADADKATTAATTAKAPFRKTSFGEKTPFETNLGKSSTFKYPPYVPSGATWPILPLISIHFAVTIRAIWATQGCPLEPPPP
jgi:hypothetical protein